MSDYDVVVVGSGAAANAAAVAALEGGAGSVLMLEATQRLGGSSAVSGGVIMAAGTSVQRAAGIEDSADRLFEHYMTFNRWRMEPALVRRFCDEGAGVIDWLIGMGVVYRPEEIYCSSIDSVPRGHVTTGWGLELFNRLHGRATFLGTQAVCNTRVTRLLTQNGRVCGVHADGQDISARAVVLACGGLGNADRALRETYYPASLHNDAIGYRGGEGNRGDAITLGLGVGAVVAKCSLNMGVLSLAPQFDLREAEGFLPAWLVFVNREGRRFMAEDAPYAVAADILLEQTDQVCHAIFDQRSFDAADGKGCKDGDMPGAPCPNWEHSVFVRNLAAGRIVKADTLEELAARIGVHGGALKENIRRYNGHVASGRDAEYFKKMAGTFPVAQAPYYATPVRAVVNTVTGAGLRINADAEVHDGADTVIPGLYAAGESAGGLVGYCVGGGSSLGPAVVMGRVAGQSVARYLKG